MLSIGIADKATLDLIAAYVDTLETMAGNISGYVDTLETKVGANTDTAGTATIFARLAQNAKSSSMGSFTGTSSSTLQTALSVTGAGTLDICGFSINGNATGGKASIVVDGTTIASITNMSAGSTYSLIMVIGATISIGIYLKSSTGFLFPVSFKTSLELQIAGDGTNIPSAVWSVSK